MKKQGKLLTITQLAKQTQLSRQYLAELRNRSGFPRHNTPNGVRYVSAEVLAFRDAHVKTRVSTQVNRGAGTPGAPPPQPPPSPPPAIAAGGDPHDQLLRMATDPRYSNEDRRAFAAVVSELRRKSESDSKAAKMFSAEKVCGYLRSVGELWVACTHAAMPIISTDLVTYIKSQFGADLEASNVVAADLIEAFIHQKLREHVIGQVNAHIKTTDEKVAES